MIDHLPIIAVNNGSSANRKACQKAIKALRSATTILQTARAEPRSGQTHTIEFPELIVCITDEGEMLETSIYGTDQPGLTIRNPSFACDDYARLALEISKISEAVIQSHLDGDDESLNSKVLARNDAICAVLGQAGRVYPNFVKLKPPSPFSPMRATIQRDAMMAEWEIDESYAHWPLANHVGFRAHSVVNKAFHLHLDCLTTHVGPRIDNPIAMMRTIASLPPAPPIIITNNSWEPMF